MSQELHSQIVVETLRDARARIFCRDPHSGRIIRTGIVAGPLQRDIDKKVLEIKRMLESKGHRVNVVCR